MQRIDLRAADELRTVKITGNFTAYPEGSILMEAGRTMVLCTATVENKLPPFLKGSGRGWVTAEYSMLPRATQERTVREAARGKISGRTQEIQRLIGRSLRSVVDLKALGERTIWIDCDVLQADGGTRTASITGGFLALMLALNKLNNQGTLKNIPVVDYLAAVSVGKVEDQPLLDLCFEEDSRAQVDMNLVMTGQGRVVEIQGTAEEYPFTRAELDQFLHLGEQGVQRLIELEKNALAELAIPWEPLR